MLGGYAKICYGLEKMLGGWKLFGRYANKFCVWIWKKKNIFFFWGGGVVMHKYFIGLKNVGRGVCQQIYGLEKCLGGLCQNILGIWKKMLGGGGVMPKYFRL